MAMDTLPPIETPPPAIDVHPDGEPLIASEWCYIEGTQRIRAHRAYVEQAS
jgi:hypothetical protein